jgi:hypothetical protein
MGSELGMSLLGFPEIPQAVLATTWRERPHLPGTEHSPILYPSYCTVLSDHYSKGPAAANTCSKRCVFHRLSHSRSAADNHILYIANGCCYHFTLNQLYCAILLKDVLVRKVRRREEEYGNHGQADSADADKSCYSS